MSVCVLDVKLASEYNIKFLETSAKLSINVEEAFITLSRDIKTKIDKKAVSLPSIFIVVNFLK